MKKFRLPYGVTEYLPDDAYAKEALEAKLSSLYFMSGFSRVMTGALEYYDLYDGVVSERALNRMFKLSDSDGSLLVLRPDTTMQISRMAATKLDASVHKLYYIENSYEFLSESGTASARAREFAQIGAEILGESGVAGDTELILLAIESLLAAGLNDFLIDIGHIGYFHGLIADANLGKNAAQATAILRESVNKKDIVSMAKELAALKIAPKKAEVFLQLCDFYGGAEILEKAKKITANTTSLAAISQLESIFTAIKEAGYEKYITLDLGLLKGGYYSGLVIRGLATDCGASILDGGRYDNLSAAFGKKTEAVGFSIGTKRLLDALEQRAKKKPLPPCTVAYINLDGFSQTEFKHIKSLQKKGLRTIKLFLPNKKALQQYCKDHNIKKAIIFSQVNIEELTI